MVPNTDNQKALFAKLNTRGNWGLAIVVLCGIAGAFGVRYWTMLPKSGFGKGDAYYVRHASDIDDVPIRHLDSVVVDFEDATDEDIDRLLKGRSFGDLYLKRCHSVTASGLKRLVDHTELVKLYVRDSAIGNELGDILVDMNKLAVLRVSNSNVTEFSQAFFENRSELQELWIGRCALTDKMTARIGELPNFSLLLLGEFRPSSTNTYEFLGDNRSIFRLGLDGSTVDESSLRALMSIPTLRYVQLSGAKGVTNEHLEALRSEFPNVSVQGEPLH